MEPPEEDGEGNLAVEEDSLQQQQLMMMIEEEDKLVLIVGKDTELALYLKEGRCCIDWEGN